MTPLQFSLLPRSRCISPGIIRIAIHLNSGPLVITLLQGIRRDQVARHRVLHDAPIKTRMRPHDVIENCALLYDVVLDVANEERNDVSYLLDVSL